MRKRSCLSIILVLALALLAPMRAVLAQPDTASLVKITLIAEGANQSIFEIAFAARIASYSTVSTDPTHPGLSLASTSRTQGAVSPPGMKGLVRAIDFDQTGAALILRFATTRPAQITVSPGGDGKLLVTVKQSTGNAAVITGPAGSRTDDPGSSYAPGAPLPRAVDPLPGEDGYELVMLKYADVSEIVGLLTEGITVKSNNTFIRREPGFGSPGTSGTTYTAQTQAAQDDKPLGQSVDSNLAIDRRLNAMWLKGSPERMARLKAQIALIDVPVDSVILETQFVELTETGARNIGIDFTNASGQLAVGTVQAGQFIPFGFGANRLDSASLQAALYAQVQSGEGRILSKPRIAAQSGSTAKIITGDALPILTAITLSGVNGVSQQVQYVNVGVTLQIAPRVSTDGFVTSNIYGVVSSVTGFSQGYPTISQREAETSASVRDGETFVIGGLTQENVISQEFKVPILGDIPLLGELFRLEKSTKTKTELYIVITPHIVRHRRFEAQEFSPPPAVPLAAPEARAPPVSPPADSPPDYPDDDAR
ncbi:MAG: type II and III secretion system protein [Alphaproteobacteria bacterium]|nr:type II and III secretion system protein [Alphaproteobacteria bacterium]